MGNRWQLQLGVVTLLLGGCAVTGGIGEEEQPAPQSPGTDAGVIDDEPTGDDDEGGGDDGPVPADPGCEVSIQQTNGDTVLASYDEAGHMLTASTKIGTAQRLNVYEWNEAGTDVTWDHSFGGSFVFDATMEYASESPTVRRPDSLLMVREGATDRSWVYTHSSGRLTRKQEYNDTLFVVDNVYTYNGSGQLTRYQVGYPNLLEDSVITRDGSGHITKLDYSVGGDPRHSDTYTYDAEGRPLSMKRSDGVEATYSYEGDDCKVAVERWRMNWPDLYEP